MQVYLSINLSLSHVLLQALAGPEKGHGLHQVAAVRGIEGRLRQQVRLDHQIVEIFLAVNAVLANRLMTMQLRLYSNKAPRQDDEQKDFILHLQVYTALVEKFVIVAMAPHRLRDYHHGQHRAGQTERNNMTFCETLGGSLMKVTTEGRKPFICLCSSSNSLHTSVE